MGEKIISHSVDIADVRPGDVAKHRFEDLDPRTVLKVTETKVYLDIVGAMGGPFPKTNYEYIRLEVVPEEDDPQGMDRKCPACKSQPGEPCSQPTNNSFRYVTWVHLSRLPSAQ